MLRLACAVSACSSSNGSSTPICIVVSARSDPRILRFASAAMRRERNARVVHARSEFTKKVTVGGRAKLAGTQQLDRLWMWLKGHIPRSLKSRAGSTLNARIWDHVYQFVHHHDSALR